jgi:hypothetical protein
MPRIGLIDSKISAAKLSDDLALKFSAFRTQELFEYVPYRSEAEIRPPESLVSTNAIQEFAFRAERAVRLGHISELVDAVQVFLGHSNHKKSAYRLQTNWVCALD